MRVRNIHCLILPIAAVFLVMLVSNTGCSTSYAQGREDRGTRGDRGGRRTQGNLKERYIQLLREMEGKGYDVSEAQALGQRAKRAAREGNRQEARQLLEQAIAKLEALDSATARTPGTPRGTVHG